MEVPVATIAGGDLDDVQKELDRQWRLARNDAATRESLAGRGIDLQALDAVGANPLTAEREGGNRADIGTMILVGIAVKIGSDLGSKALQEFWEKVLRPTIEKRFGTTTPVTPDQPKPGA